MGSGAAVVLGGRGLLAPFAKSWNAVVEAGVRRWNLRVGEGCEGRVMVQSLVKNLLSFWKAGMVIDFLSFCFLFPVT